MRTSSSCSILPISGILLLLLLFLWSNPSFINSPITLSSPAGNGHYGAPQWSPDGNHVAFAFKPQGAGIHQLWILDIVTEETSRFFIDIDGFLDVTDDVVWLDNNTILAVYHIFQSGEFRNYLCQADLYTHQLTILDFERILEDNDIWIGLSLNPTGKQITYSKIVKNNQETCCDLFEFDLASGSSSRLTNTADKGETGPIWSPNGQELAYLIDQGIEVLSLDGTSYLLEIPITPDAYRFTWSPDGNWFLFVGDYRQPGLYLISSRNTNEIRQILDEPIAYVDWSPTGSHIAYTTVGGPGRNNLVIADAESLDLPILSQTE